MEQASATLTKGGFLAEILESVRKLAFDYRPLPSGTEKPCRLYFYHVIPA